MQRKFKSKTRGELFVEQVVWNAAAGAALAVMVLLLLFSLQWLDRISPSPRVDPRSGVESARVARPAVASARNTLGPLGGQSSETRPTRVAEAIGPSG